MVRKVRCLVGAGVAVGVCVSAADAQLRVATWNVTTYSQVLPSPRDAAFQTAIYGVFEGRSMAPDILIGQEFTSAAAVAAFLAMLNSAPGGPGDWAAAPYVGGPDTNNAFFYRTSKVEFLQLSTISTGGFSPNPPRNTERYDVRLAGYASAGASLACYSSHMKSGTSADDQARRLKEAQRIRADAGTLPQGWAFLLGGDFNIQASFESAYQALVGPAPGESGRLFDPIRAPGSWNNNGAFRFIHSQAPGGQSPSQTGGMDDRYDQILLAGALVDGAGMDYVGSLVLSASASTWNDPNHSHRAWGNDGSSYNQILTVNGNQMVGPVIAQALRDSTSADTFGGHLPVFLDLRVPAKIDAPLQIDFGTVPQHAPAEITFTVTNSGDVGLWSAGGIADLNYTMGADPGFTVAPGPFIEPPGGAGNEHVLSLDTGTPGPVSGMLVITSDAPDDPVWTIALTGTVAGACYPDCNGDGALNLADFGCFQTKFALQDPYADCNGDGALNLADFGCFQTKFALGCP